MRNHSGVSSHMLGCALLLLASCGYSTGGNTSGGSQAGQSSTSGTSSGGSTASSGGTSRSSSSGGSSQAGGSSSSSSSSAGQAGATSSSSTQAGMTTGGQTTGTATGGQAGKATTGGRTGGSSSSGGSSSQAGGTAGATGSGGAASAGTTSTGTGGKTSGQAGSTGTGGQTGSTSSGAGGSLANGCVGGKEWPTANPTAAGPFKVFAQKKVGPFAGALPDPIYGDEQQQFNIYRPENIKDSGYCHPVLVWANGFKDNPEENPPKCIINHSDQWCGQYSPILKHLASHGFVVIASLSTTTGSGNPLPTIVGLDWLLQQAEDPASDYYHRLDTSKIGAYGHSMGGMSTCKSASEPRYKALAALCGTSALSGVHTPMNRKSVV